MKEIALCIKRAINKNVQSVLSKLGAIVAWVEKKILPQSAGDFGNLVNIFFAMNCFQVAHVCVQLQQQKHLKLSEILSNVS